MTGHDPGGENIFITKIIPSRCGRDIVAGIRFVDEIMVATSTTIGILQLRTISKDNDCHHVIDSFFAIFLNYPL
jgi:hypothetical protein